MDALNRQVCGQKAGKLHGGPHWGGIQKVRKVKYFSYPLLGVGKGRTDYFSSLGGAPLLICMIWSSIFLVVFALQK